MRGFIFSGKGGAVILSELKEYLKLNEQVSLRDVAVHFNLSETAAQAMLEHWERKGKVGRLESSHCVNPCGQKCGDCPLQCLMIYQWKEPVNK